MNFVATALLVLGEHVFLSGQPLLRKESTSETKKASWRVVEGEEELLLFRPDCPYEERTYRDKTFLFYKSCCIKKMCRETKKRCIGCSIDVCQFDGRVAPLSTDLRWFFCEPCFDGVVKGNKCICKVDLLCESEDAVSFPAETDIPPKEETIRMCNESKGMYSRDELLVAAFDTEVFLAAKRNIFLFEKNINTPFKVVSISDGFFFLFLAHVQIHVEEVVFLVPHTGDTLFENCFFEGIHRENLKNIRDGSILTRAKSAALDASFLPKLKAEKTASSLASITLYSAEEKKTVCGYFKRAEIPQTTQCLYLKDSAAVAFEFLNTETVLPVLYLDISKETILGVSEPIKINKKTKTMVLVQNGILVLSKMAFEENKKPVRLFVMDNDKASFSKMLRSVEDGVYCGFYFKDMVWGEHKKGIPELSKCYENIFPKNKSDFLFSLKEEKHDDLHIIGKDFRVERMFENESICFGEIRNLSLHEDSVLFLSKIKIPKENKMRCLSLAYTQKDLKQKTNIGAKKYLGKVENICVSEYGACLLQKIAVSKENTIDCIQIEIDEKDVVDQFENTKNIFLGAIENIETKNYGVFVLGFLVLPEKNLIKKLCVNVSDCLLVGEILKRKEISLGEVVAFKIEGICQDAQRIIKKKICTRTGLGVMTHVAKELISRGIENSVQINYALI
ncbi:MAG: uncharacterized protein A8A55_1279 [Amphiamblys sp. WSBS2006]|nr:MAG: uncharacterized protein A8A55_1279 [Amphiamblys sp. WSBS2006]